MTVKKQMNPFPAVDYAGPEYFCDRKEETEQLLRNIENGNSVTIIAVRRIGKTGLIRHVLHKLPVGWKGVYVDILETENMNQFLNVLASSIISSAPPKSSIGKKFIDFIRSLRPVIKYDGLTGEPNVSFEISKSDAVMNVDAILKFLEKQEYRILVCIDEFQQILKYPEKNTDAWLRTRIQHMKNVCFVFSGSQQHLMTELFSSPGRPFFRSTMMMKLGKIDSMKYSIFIKKMFSKGDKEISPAIVSDILNWSHHHTYYVQRLLNRVFSATIKEVTDEIWKNEASLLLKEQESVFLLYRNMLTTQQWQLLKAIAYEGPLESPTAGALIARYRLGSSAAVLRSLNALIEKELVYFDYSKENKKSYDVYDIWFKQWCRER